jgi:hypothetical protein
MDDLIALTLAAVRDAGWTVDVAGNLYDQDGESLGALDAVELGAFSDCCRRASRPSGVGQAGCGDGAAGPRVPRRVSHGVR